MKAFYAVGLLLLINAQVNSSPATLDDDTKDFHEQLDKTKKESIYESRELENPPAEHSKILKCYQQADIQMEQLRLDSINDLFNCDLFKELNETVPYAKQIPGMDPNFIYNLAKDLINCVSRDQITEALCITKANLAFSKNIESILPKFEDYEDAVQAFGKEVRAMFQHCAHRKDQEFKRQLKKIFKERDSCL
uniref:Putative secreted protein rhodnius neglectus n=3 Tax=Rhodnius TaxID=13248 RepID=A0A4P6D969_RHOPR